MIALLLSAALAEVPVYHRGVSGLLGPSNQVTITADWVPRLPWYCSLTATDGIAAAVHLDRQTQQPRVDFLSAGWPLRGCPRWVRGAVDLHTRLLADHVEFVLVDGAHRKRHRLDDRIPFVVNRSDAPLPPGLTVDPDLTEAGFTLCRVVTADLVRHVPKDRRTNDMARWDVELACYTP